MSIPEVRYGLTKELPEVSYDDAVARTTEALKGEGFGVLTSIDVKTTLKEKIDVDFKRYVILGACNPKLAHKALSGEPLIGLLLPCNFVVMERDEGGSVVSAFRPTEAFQLVDNAGVQPLAAEVEEKLVRSNYLHQISEGIYDQVEYFHDIRGIQEICERKHMKMAVAKYLELYARTNYRPKKKIKKKSGKSYLF